MTKTGVSEETLFNAALLQWMNELAGQGILVTDAELNIRAWNRWLEEHSEIGADEVLGRNLLDVRVSFSVPRLHLETLDELLASLIAAGSEPQYALVVYTAFQIRDSAVRGFLVMVLSVTSLDRLIQEVDAWEERQGHT